MQIGGSQAQSQRVKVAILVDSIAHPGGGETLAVETALLLDPERYERVLCVTRWKDPSEGSPGMELLERVREAGIRLLPLRRRSWRTAWAWAPLIRLLRRERFDVVHGHMFGSNVWAVVIGRLCRVPVVIAHEHMWSYRNERSRALIDRRLIARGSDAFIAVSEEGRRLMVEREGIKEGEIVLIRNGMPNMREGDGPRVRGELGIPAGADVVVSVGHLRREKAYEVLIDAASLILADRSDLVVLIAGEGEERESLERRIAGHGLERQVRLLGPRRDIPDLLAAADIAVCCSDFEGGPLSVMEYMEAGLPVVATAVGGLPELVLDGETGYLIPPRDADALARALRSLLEDRPRMTEMGQAARRLRRERWGIDRWIGEIEGLYDSLLRDKRDRKRD